MNFFLECKKMRRTGFYPAFAAGGILASCMPVVNMAVRAEIFTGQEQPPLQILLDANWTMMSMLNILLIITGACIMYHTEYGNNAIQKIQSLPVKESHIFFAKFILMTGMCILSLAIEACTLLFCCLHWFKTDNDLYLSLIKYFGLFLILLLPAVLISLAIASAFKNMWISLGIGVVCVFAASMIISADYFILQIFPFALPLQTLTGTASETVTKFLTAVGFEIFVTGCAELTFLRIRKSLV
ncbi:MAG: ABC transporter permease [Lachnospiraceae bacterium]|nr:ABC transporter permease [Lachnospiraceae bacterium]